MKTLILSLFIAAFSLNINSQIILDYTLVPPVYPPITGPYYVLEEMHGARVGDNLFFSFEMFNLLPGESLIIAADPNIKNVFIRVIGLYPSIIDGLLTSTVGHQGVYIMNSSGIMFGPTGFVDVLGDFTITTADYISFGGPEIFYCDPINPSAPSMNPPIAFGFLDAFSSSIEMYANIMAPKNLFIVSENITLMDIFFATLHQGSLYMAAPSSIGELPLPTMGIDVSNFSTLGNILVNTSNPNFTNAEYYTEPKITHNVFTVCAQDTLKDSICILDIEEQKKYIRIGNGFKDTVSAGGILDDYLYYNETEQCTYNAIELDYANVYHKDTTVINTDTLFYLYDTITKSDVYMLIDSSTNCGEIIYLNVDFKTTIDIEELYNQTTEISVYPNPTSNYIKLNNYVKEAQILDINGKILLVETDTKEIDINTLQTGVYLLIIRTENGRFGKLVLKE